MVWILGLIRNHNNKNKQPKTNNYVNTSTGPAGQAQCIQFHGSGIAAKVLDIRKEIIRDSLSDFQNVEHRLEKVAKIHGIDFINDSKATNVNATWYALESMQKPTIWIVGGVDKGNDYSSLKGLVKQKVLGIICLGKRIIKFRRSLEKLYLQFMKLSLRHKPFKLVTE